MRHHFFFTDQACIFFFSNEKSFSNEKRAFSRSREQRGTTSLASPCNWHKLFPLSPTFVQLPYRHYILILCNIFCTWCIFYLFINLYAKFADTNHRSMIANQAVNILFLHTHTQSQINCIFILLFEGKQINN